MPRISLAEVLDHLEALYGPPRPPKATDPWHLILWENVAYLADDEQREKAFLVLRKRVGTRPEQILSAPAAVLREVGAHGIVPEQSVEKLRRCATIALEEFDGDLGPVLRLPVAKAKKALKKFPGIGDPGAEKLLLFAGVHPALALESNGLRVLLRLGYGEEKKSYATTYRLVQTAVAPELKKDCAWLMRAHLLLRRHGQELCRRSRPQCGECPLAADCPHAAAGGAGP
jgi:endonuclease III